MSLLDNTYILRKALSNRKAVDALRDFRKLVSVLPVDDRIIALALDADFRDFEDAIQYHTALNKGVSHLITRNVRDYPKPSLTICTAEEFLAQCGGA